MEGAARFDADAGGLPDRGSDLGRSEAPAAAQAAREAVDEWQPILADRLVGSGAAPDSARSLATLTVAAIEGDVILAIATQSTAALDDVGRHLIEVMTPGRAVRPKLRRSE